MSLSASPGCASGSSEVRGLARRALRARGPPTLSELSSEVCLSSLLSSRVPSRSSALHCVAFRFRYSLTRSVELSSRFGCRFSQATKRCPASMPLARIASTIASTCSPSKPKKQPMESASYPSIEPRSSACDARSNKVHATATTNAGATFAFLATPSHFGSVGAPCQERNQSVIPLPAAVTRRREHGFPLNEP